MQVIKTFEGHLSAQGARFCLVSARFNGFIVESLVSGAMDALIRHGVPHSDIHQAKVPGAFELPLAVKHLVATGRYDAIIALGAIIRGSTPHFDYVASECVKGLSSASFDAGLPVAFGVLTVDSIEQAIERAGTKAGNKGAEAAMTALEMVSLIREINAG